MRLRLAVPSCLALALAAMPTAARSAPQFLIHVEGPYTEANATQSLTMPCSITSAVQRFVVTFEPAAEMTDFVAFQGLVDVIVTGHPIDDAPFWRVDEQGCNANKLSATIAPPADLDPGIVVPWTDVDAGTAAVAACRVSYERIAFLVWQQTPVTLEPGTRYYACTINVPTIRGQVCAGCDAPATLVAQTAWCEGLDSANDQQLYSAGQICINGPCAVPAQAPDPTIAHDTRARQIGTPVLLATCDAVPAHHATWGELKLMYH